MERKCASLVLFLAITVSTSVLAQQVVVPPTEPAAPAASQPVPPDNGPLPAGDEAGSERAAGTVTISPIFKYSLIGAGVAGMLCVVVCGRNSSTTTTTTSPK